MPLSVVRNRRWAAGGVVRVVRGALRAVGVEGDVQVIVAVRVAGEGERDCLLLLLDRLVIPTAAAELERRADRVADRERRVRLVVHVDREDIPVVAAGVAVPCVEVDVEGEGVARLWLELDPGGMLRARLLVPVRATGDAEADSVVGDRGFTGRAPLH